jgi:hypothetical protein
VCSTIVWRICWCSRRRLECLNDKKNASISVLDWPPERKLGEPVGNEEVHSHEALTEIAVPFLQKVHVRCQMFFIFLHKTLLSFRVLGSLMILLVNWWPHRNVLLNIFGLCVQCSLKTLKELRLDWKTELFLNNAHPRRDLLY